MPRKTKLRKIIKQTPSPYNSDFTAKLNKLQAYLELQFLFLKRMD